MIREPNTPNCVWHDEPEVGDPAHELRALDCKTAIETMRVMSAMTEPDDLVEVFAARVREVIQVDRTLVISRRSLEYPDYHVEISQVWSETAGRFVEGGNLGTYRGGLLAEILYSGELRLMKDLWPSGDDEAIDLLAAERSLMAFPLFDKGKVAGMVVLLSRWPNPCAPSELIALSLMTNLLDRAVQSQGLAKELAITCNSLDRELQAAADVQQWLLPADLPDIAGVNLAASYCPAKECGGDYYDVAELGEGKLGLFIADVSGKGAPAAVLVGVLRTFVELNRSLWLTPARLLSDLNRHLCSVNLSEHGAFVTAFCGVLDVRHGRLTYASAGHNPPRLIRKQPFQVNALDGGRGLPLGITEKANYYEDQVAVHAGELLLLYTDGVVEAASPNGDQFGVDRLDGVLLELTAVPDAEQAIEAVAGATREFCGGRQASDDQALVAVGLSAATAEGTPCNDSQETVPEGGSNRTCRPHDCWTEVADVFRG